MTDAPIGTTGEGMNVYWRMDRLIDVLDSLLDGTTWDAVKNPRMLMLEALSDEQLRLLNEVVYLEGVKRGYNRSWQA